MATEGKIDWKGIGKKALAYFGQGLAIGTGLAVSGAAAGFVASRVNRNQSMTTAEAGQRGARARNT